MFARFAGRGDDGSPRYELNDDLARLYFELAEWYGRGGRRKLAEAAERRAFQYGSRGTPSEPRPSAAIAMANPTPLVFTEAYGKSLPPEDPEISA